jgi:hypothetical protein
MMRFNERRLLDKDLPSNDSSSPRIPVDHVAGVFLRETFSFTGNDRTLNDILQFANITWPRGGLKQL